MRSATCMARTHSVHLFGVCHIGAYRCCAAQGPAVEATVALGRHRRTVSVRHACSTESQFSATIFSTVGICLGVSHLDTCSVHVRPSGAQLSRHTAHVCVQGRCGSSDTVLTRLRRSAGRPPVAARAAGRAAWPARRRPPGTAARPAGR